MHREGRLFAEGYRGMKFRAVSGIMLTLLLIGMLALAFNIQQVKAEPKTIYVDASNIDDPFEDGTIDHPFDKIQEGIDAAISGEDTVVVAEGTYYENIILKDGVVVQGAGASVTIIDGGGNGPVVIADNVDTSTVLEGFTLKNGIGAGIDCDFASPLIKNNIITNNQGLGVATGGASTPQIIDNVIANSSRCGVLLWASSPTIRGNTIKDNQGTGIETNNVNSFVIENNIITGNGGRGGIEMLLPCCLTVGPTIVCNTIADNLGVGIYTNFNYATIVNNVIVENMEEGIYGNPDYNFATPTIDFNDVWNNGEGDYGGIASAGVNDISAEPMFMDAVAGDYNLQAGSSCIDTGTNEDAPSIDFEGNPRPIDGDGDGIAVVDMGASEFIPPKHNMRLHVTSLSITGIIFNINGTPQTTPYTEWLAEALYILDMPETYDRYVWSHWLEDGNTNRTKTLMLTDNTTCTGVFTATPDINGDGLVDILDIVVTGKAFASYPGHPRWDYRADMNTDDVVDIFDLVLIASNFGKSA